MYKNREHRNLMHTETEEVLGDGQVVTGVKVKNRATGETKKFQQLGFRSDWSQTKHRYFCRLHYVRRNRLYCKCTRKF